MHARSPILGLALAILLICAAQAHAQSDCVEQAGPTTTAKSPRQLESSIADPTLTIALRQKSEADGEVRLPARDATVGRTARAASAEMIERPSFKNDDLDARVTLAAKPTQGGRSVTVFACVTQAKDFQAGRYEGVFEVTGTRIAPFSYAISITKRWPFWVPLAILGALWVVVVGAEFFRSATGLKGNLLVLLIATLALAGTYYGQYVYNDTWGDELAEQLGALVAAGLASVTSARATATRFARKR